MLFRYLLHFLIQVLGFNLCFAVAIGRIVSGTLAIQTATKLLSTDALISGRQIPAFAKSLGATRTLSKFIPKDGEGALQRSVGAYAKKDSFALDYASSNPKGSKGEREKLTDSFRSQFPNDPTTKYSYSAIDHYPFYQFENVDVAKNAGGEKSRYNRLTEPYTGVRPSAAGRLSRKEAKKAAQERKEFMEQFEKRTRMHLARIELGQLAKNTDLPKITAQIVDGSLKMVDIKYTQAFTTKHLGSADRGPHSGAFNTILDDPAGIVLGLARNLRGNDGKDRYGVPGIDIPDSILEELGISKDSTLAQVRRVAVPSVNQADLTSYKRVDLNSNKPSDRMRWVFDQSADKKSRIEIEGYLLPKGLGGLKTNTLIVDHMHPIDE